MQRYIVRLMPEAERDLLSIYRYVRDISASGEVARRYVERISGFLATLETFPERGTVRNEIREGLRIVGFEGRASVAFMVEADSVIVFRIAYGGQEVGLGDM